MPNSEISYTEYKPCNILNNYIKTYWHFKIETTETKSLDILPDGYFDLLIVFQNNVFLRSKLTGIWTENIHIEYSENTEVFGVRFKPLAIGTIFPFSINNLVNSATPINLADLSISQQFVVENINSGIDKVVNHLNKVFEALTNQQNIDNRLLNCFHLIDVNKGDISIKTLSEQVGISPRQLRRIINNKLGISVKDYTNIVRFKKSMLSFKANKLDINSYYDQSHFIKNIKQYTGLTPSKLELGYNDRFLQYYDFNAK